MRGLFSLAHRAFFAAVAAAILSATAVYGGGIVTNAVEADLRAALDGGGLVTLAFDGEIALTSAISVEQPTILDASGHAVTLSGGQARRLFYIVPGSSLSLTNLVLTKGQSTNGAAIYNQGTLTAVSCRFSSNVVGSALQVAGGAIYNVGTADLKWCTLSNNAAIGVEAVHSSALGGAIYNNGTLAVSACYFSANTSGGIGSTTNFAADTSGHGFGGALYNANVATVSATTFAYNKARGMNGSWFGGSGYGGAVYSCGQLGSTNSTFYGNQALGGSAYGVPHTTLGRPGGGLGGAVCVVSGAATLDFCTLSANIAGDLGPKGTAAYVETNATLTLHSSIAARNSTNSALSVDVGTFYGTVVDAGFNVCSELNAPLASATSIKGVDPVLGPLGDYGGFAPTVALLSTSPVINLGDPTRYPALDQRGINRPQSGTSDPGAFELESTWPRVIHFAAASFLAEERQTEVTITVTCEGNPTGLVTVDCSTTDGSALAGINYAATNLTLAFDAGETSKSFQVRILANAVFDGVKTFNVHLAHPTGSAVIDSPQDAVVTIRENSTDVISTAELQAAVAAGGRITFASNGTLVLPQPLVITNQVMLDGSHRQVTLTGLQTQRLFEVRSGGVLYLRNLIVTGGSASQGGALLNSGGGVTIEGCQFRYNSAPGAPSVSYSPAEIARGGAILNASGTMHIWNSSFTSNSCTGGRTGSDHYLAGASGFGGAICNSGVLAVAQTTFELNYASGGRHRDDYLPSPYPVSGGYGGAVCNFGFLTMTNVTLSGNFAGINYFETRLLLSAYEGRGGGLYNASGTAIVQNVTMASNSLGPDYLRGLRGFNLGNSNGLVYVGNTILAGASSATNSYGGVIDLGHNLSTDGSGLTDPTSLLWTDPKLLPLADNGGPTRTMALQPDSPAIDQGLLVAGVTTDQRGAPRPVGSAPDIGAYEFQGEGIPAIMWLGATAGVAGGNACLSVSLTSTTGLTNLSFVLCFPPGRFTNFTAVPLKPEVGTATVSPLNDTQALVTLVAGPNLTMQGPSELAQVCFDFLPNPLSVIANVWATNIQAWRHDGIPVGNSPGTGASVLFLGDQPILTYCSGSNHLSALQLYAKPGWTCAIDESISPGTGGTWREVGRLSVTDFATPFTVNPTNSTGFYRARRLLP